jgi:hypothetical protein
LSLASSYIGDKWDYNEEEANFFVSIVDITIMIASPLLGLLVDFSGFNGWAGNDKFKLQPSLIVKFHLYC